MGVVFSAFVLFFTIITSFFSTLTTSASPALHPDELKALGEIATTLGIKRLNLSDGDPCLLKTLKLDVVSSPNSDMENIILCDCSFNNNMTCHIIELKLKSISLSGKLPPELAKLKYLQNMDLVSNQFTGSLPSSLARLVNLETFRISDNNFTGIIPEYISNWSQLQRLDLQASGLKGPFPDAVARLENLTYLFISDMTGINSFPNISSQVIKDLVLRNVSMSGKIPSYIWSKPNLRSLDLSFNKLTGEVLGINPVPKFTYLTGNMLSGEIKSGVYLNSRSNIDLSYNNFSLPSSCQERSNINTYRSSSLKNTLTGLLPCAGPITCKHYRRSLHINCGGETVTVTNSIGKITYQADNIDQVKAATNQHFKNWGISNTGDFMDDNIDDDTYIVSTSLTLPGDSPDLYKTARRSALSLVYYAFCLENGEYNLKLHFMEIQFSDQELYSRLGRRIFDVYVQGKLFLRDFNIRQEANGTLKSIVKELKAVNVTDHKLEIWLYWAGKGTTLIPKRGNYGPLISAISLCHSLEQHCGVEKTKRHINYPLIFGVTGPLVAIIFLALGFYAHRKCRQDKKKREREEGCLSHQTLSSTLNQRKLDASSLGLMNNPRICILSGGKTKAMAMVVSGGKMPLHANALPLSIINTKTRVRSVSTVPLFSPASHSPSSSLSIRFKLSPRVSRSLSVVSSVLSEDRATGVSGSGGTDAFKLTYLEGNSWLWETSGLRILVDPILVGNLDFGIPWLYDAAKRFLNGFKLDDLPEVDCLLITQSLDDHCHLNTLRPLSKKSPDLKVIATPNAKPLLDPLFRNITYLEPGESYELNARNGSKVRVKATAGPVLGPPWQRPENGYLLASPEDQISLYYEPHCVCNMELLKNERADIVITPVIKQLLPQFTLVSGQEDAVQLAKILKAKFIVPMQNGDLDAKGILASIIKKEGTIESFKDLLSRELPKAQVLEPIAGVPLEILPPTSDV
ncbi:probable LRR receptor-like serine/threonine-protein kinase At1g29720 isoform X3 [Brassica rapa]|uniref:probable LRR receptor-like serine/threonine-protein kinase At1g29720 isoform X3 n=1 Tax=Brassica campestris TaxID=3711 RepID=UPI00142D7019|nr:probable LRR receptor-like serine/threonine-protein kinase At1g29720 isoform X3 [Brassica rapa]